LTLSASHALFVFALLVVGCARADASKPAAAADPNPLAISSSSGSGGATRPGGAMDPATPARSTATVPIATSATSATPLLEPCTARADHAVTIVARPHAATAFGQLDPGDDVTIEARSRGGWLGFDPGVAQAANVGPFRLRWLDPARVATQGNCANVPEVWTPPPGICFEMTMDDAIVRDAPRADGRVLATLHRGEFAALVGRHGKWAKVELATGNTTLAGSGFIAEDALNVSGDCDALLKR
jgi:hypothetical protein